MRRSKKAATDSAGNALIDEVVNPSRDYKAEYQAEQQRLPAEESTFDVERALANEAELERVKAENERLAGLVSSLKEQMVLTKGYRPNEKALARVARNVLKQTASKYSEDELKGDLRTLFDYLGTQKDFNGDEAMALANQIARKVLEQSTERDTDLYDASKGEREYFRENAVYLSEEQKSEVARVVPSGSGGFPLSPHFCLGHSMALTHVQGGETYGTMHAILAGKLLFPLEGSH